MNFKLLLLFFTLFLFSFLQIKAVERDSTLVPIAKHFYSLTSLSPDICFITIKIRPDESGKHHNWESYYVNQKVSTGYRFTQLLGWQKNRHWAFEGGIMLSKKVMNVDFNQHTAIPEVKVKNGSLGAPFYRTNYSCLEVPVRVVFTAGKKAFRFFSFFGINKTFCYDVYQEQLVYSNDQIVSNQLNTKNTNAKRVFSASDWGAGCKYIINASSQIRLNAAVQRSYASVKLDNKKILFWNTGIALGYCYYW